MSEIKILKDLITNTNEFDAADLCDMLIICPSKSKELGIDWIKKLMNDAKIKYLPAEYYLDKNTKAFTMRLNIGETLNQYQLQAQSVIAWIMYVYGIEPKDLQ